MNNRKNTYRRQTDIPSKVATTSRTLSRSSILGAGLLMLASCSIDNSKDHGPSKELAANIPTVAAMTLDGYPECTGFVALPGEKRWVPALPDKAARYDTYGFDVSTGSFDAIRIQGRFPYARYFSLNIYDSQTGLNIGVLTDKDIVPLPGNVNPFQDGGDRTSDARSFEVYLTPEGSGFVPPSGVNVLEYPASELTTMALVTRVYRADQGQDDLGGVGLPILSAFNDDPATAACPERVPFNSDSLGQGGENDGIEQRDLFLELQGNETIFVRTAGTGLYPNADNLYITAAHDNNNVTVLRFLAPTFEDTYLGSPVFIGGTQTRYWSLCVGGLVYTTTSACIEDDRVPVGADGYATVVIGPERQREMTEDAGFAFMPRGNNAKAVIVHRHMLDAPDFEGRLELTPELPAVLPADFSREDLDALDARTAIGDYAPTGMIMTERQYRLWLNN